MGKCWACCSPCCRCKKKKSRAVSVVSSSPSLNLFPIPVSTVDEDDEVINLEDLPMSIAEIEAHYQDVRNIYAYAIETMKNFLGKPCYPYNTLPKQLYPYILYLCEGLQAHEYIYIKEKVAERELSNIQVTIMIKDAKLIHPKLTEFSRIFCKLWINNEDQRMTRVKEGTTNLLWDETFVLDIIDYESDIIHVEVWSSRPGLLEKMSLVTQESFKEDDPLAEENGMYFIGDAFEYVKSLPCVGENALWTLKKGPRRAYTKGQINMYLQIGTKKTSDFMLHLYCNLTFIKLCYEKQVSEKGESHSFWTNWLEILPNEAVTLIQQHAIQHGIAPNEQCLCSWLVASSLKMKVEDRISFYLLKDLMEYLLANITEIEIGQTKDLFSKSLTDFSVFSLDMLRNIHAKFDLQEVESSDELFYLLGCMSLVELRLCTNYMDSFEALESESSEWYHQIIREQKRSFQDDESIENLCEVLKKIMKIYLKNQIILDDIFMRAWNIRYTCITYKELDKVVCVTLQPMIKHITVLIDDPKHKAKRSESLLMLQLYHNVRNLVNYVINIIPSQSILLRMDEYSTWFGEELVLEWFLLCDLYTSQFIQRAVLADTMEKLSKNIFHGTSVPDMITIIDEMVVDVWMKLKWEDQFYTHGALIEAIKSCILYYSKGMIDRLDLEQFFCHFEEFEISVKLCVAMSNMFALSEHILLICKKIKKELEVAESALGFTLSQPLLTIQSEISDNASSVFLLVVKKISKRIKKLIKNSLTEKTESIIYGQLSLYMDMTLEVLYLNLKSEAFNLILRQLWIVLVNGLKKGMKAKRCFMTKKRKLRVYMVILQILNQMKAIFHCDGSGLDQDEMENEVYQELRCALEKKLAVQ